MLLLPLEKKKREMDSLTFYSRNQGSEEGVRDYLAVLKGLCHGEYATLKDQRMIMARLREGLREADARDLCLEALWSKDMTLR